MNTANGIKVTLVGAILIVNGERMNLKAGGTLEDVKKVARYFRDSCGYDVQLKRGVIGEVIEPATERDARIRDRWEANAGNEDDDGSWQEENPWTWKIVGEKTVQVSGS